jgi:hypothetical protein
VVVVETTITTPARHSFNGSAETTTAGRRPDCSRPAGDRGLPQHQDDAAHEDEDQEKRERDEVEYEPERGDDAAEAEA